MTSFHVENINIDKTGGRMIIILKSLDIYFFLQRYGLKTKCIVPDQTPHIVASNLRLLIGKRPSDRAPGIMG